MKYKSITIVFILLAGYGLEAWGQGGMTSGMFGPRNVGGTATMGASNFGGSSLGGMGASSMGGMGMSSMGGMGMSSMGGMGMGSSGLGGMGIGSSGGMGMSGMSGMSGTSSLGNNFGNMQTGQFIGGNTGQTFIGGNNATGQTSGMGMGGMGTMRGTTGMNSSFGSMGGMGGQFGGMRGNQFGQTGFGQNRYGMQNSSQAQMKVTRRVDIENLPKAITEVNSGLTLLLKRTVVSRSPLSSVEASYQGRTVVLKGVVATARDRELAAKLVRLEPGVDQVQNDLVVKTAEKSDSKADIPDSSK